MIRVYIVDDHEIVIEGLYALLQNDPAITITGFATSGAHCIQHFSYSTADVILMDISMPEMGGIELCHYIKEHHPEIMVLALSTFDQGSYIRKMMENGASGYLLKNAGKQEIIKAITIAASGKTYLSFAAGKSLVSDNLKMRNLPRLTKREKEVLALIVQGLTNVQIGTTLFISPDTVDSHRKNLHLKLNVTNTASLVRLAIEYNLFEV